MSTENPQTPNTAFEKFPRVAPLLTVILMAVTFTLYIPYWLYTRTRILNSLYPQKPISPLFMALCIGGYVMLMVLAYQLPEHLTLAEVRDNPQFQTVVSAASFVGLLQLIWLALFCQRLNLCTGVSSDHPLYASYLILMLTNFLVLNVIYLQYKINQIRDSQHKPDTPAGILQA